MRCVKKWLHHTVSYIVTQRYYEVCYKVTAPYCFLYCDTEVVWGVLKSDCTIPFPILWYRGIMRCVKKWLHHTVSYIVTQRYYEVCYKVTAPFCFLYCDTEVLWGVLKSDCTILFPILWHRGIMRCVKKWLHHTVSYIVTQRYYEVCYKVTAPYCFLYCDTEVFLVCVIKWLHRTVSYIVTQRYYEVCYKVTAPYCFLYSDTEAGFYRTQYMSYTHKSLGRTRQFTLPASAGTQMCLLCLSLKSKIPTFLQAIYK